MARSSVYVETTVPSYLTARPSSSLIIAGQQQCTREWWSGAVGRYELMVSPMVLLEVSQGDGEAARQRLSELSQAVVLPEHPSVLEIAREYVTLLSLPPKAKADAVHLAYAVAFELDYLVTWNMRHLANSLTMRRITEYNRDRDLWIPLIVTPQYLLDLEPQEKP